MRICFDMDGTIANLYAVEGWLADLRAENPRPYAEAAVLLNMNVLARRLNRLQAQGHEIVVISWLAKVSTPAYDEAVAEVKRAWLKKHLGSVKFDEINIVPYGVDKNIFCHSADDVLFDDEDQNRNGWGGRAYNVNDILGVLATL